MSLLENILTSLGIEMRMIIPTNVSQKFHRQKSNFSQFDSDISYFPLEWFDSNTNDDDCVQIFAYCREGFAFIPSSSSSASKQSTYSNDYEWRKVSIKQYDNKSNKWHIQVDDKSSSYEVPRIYLMFIVEDALKFAKRIVNAVQQRDDYESCLRFEALLNAYPKHRIPLPSSPADAALQFHDKKRVTRTKADKDLIEFYQREFTIVYQKAIAAFLMIKHHPFSSTISNRNFQFLLEVSSRNERRRKLKNLTMECVDSRNFKKSRKSIQHLWLYCCPQSIKIMEFINNECEHVSRMSLFHLQTSSCSWQEFRDENNLKLQLMLNYMQVQWIDKIVNEIQHQLANVDKGWYDLRCMTSWSIYEMSKLHRMIEMIKQRMEASIIILLKSSLWAYVNHLCQSCECLLDISDDFQWNDDDLLYSPFQSSTPLFNIHLNVNDEEGALLLDIENSNIENEIVEMFEKSILTTHQIPQIDPYLITKLKFDVKNLKLSSIGLLNEEIQNQIFHLRRCYKKCLIALYAYARQYNKFIELKSLNVSHYVEKFLANSSAYEMHDEIHNQMHLCDEIRASIPESIIIGPFFISIECLRSNLINKRMEIVKDLKRILIQQASEKVDDILLRYDAIITRLTDKPLSIEHLDDIAKWIPSVENQVDQLSDEMKATLTAHFKCIESFLMTLPDEIFTMKWRTLEMPQIVNRKINETHKQQAYDIDIFRRKHANDEIVFLEKLNAIADDIDACIGNSKIISSEIDNLWNELHRMLDRGKLLNRRCELFNQPEIDIEERLNAYIQRLFPHHKFWTMTSNFLTSKEMWMEKVPLSVLDIQSIEAEIKRYDAIVEESREYVGENVVEEASFEMREVMKFFNIISELKNLDIHEEHWKRLNERNEIKFEFTSATTFNELLTCGIEKVTASLRDISMEVLEDATREREKEIEMELRRQRDEEVERKKKLRRLARRDIFN